ncbi:MAG: porin [Gammaproteobacteria bacterium]|nr:porin [Gammaproteobacteria bacterium]
MKFKTSAIALAVAGTVAAPVVVQAGADELYASARVGLENIDSGDVSELRVRSMASRFGAKGETDLGNGMTGFGRYEWDVDFNTDTGEDDIGLRHRYVGLKGDFGSVLLGQTYHTFYNHVVGPNDNPWWSSGYAMVSYTGRTGNGITYAGSSGAFSFGLTAYFIDDFEDAKAAVPSVSAPPAPIEVGSAATAESGDEGVDGVEFGVSFGIGDMTLGVAVQDIEAVDDAVTGIALTGISLGDVSIGLGFQVNDDDDSFLADIGIGNAYVHIEANSVDATDQDRLMTTLGYTQSLGRKTTAYYEFMQLDEDTGDSDDDTTAIRAVLKYDII